MKCKFCNAEIKAEDSFCPFCGKENVEPEKVTAEGDFAVEETVGSTLVEEATPEGKASPFADSPYVMDQTYQNVSESTPGKKPKKNVWMYIAIAACCALLLLLSVMIWQNVKDKLLADQETTASTQGVVMDTYNASVEEVLAAADKVVATIGEHKLTNRQLQIFYWSGFYEFVNYYGNYLSYYGLDYTKPLNEQTVPDSESTWEQYFVDVGLDSWHRYLALYLDAQKNGFELDAEAKAALEQLPTSLEANAKEYGFNTVEEMLAVDMGEGTTMADYAQYMEMYYIGMQYYNYLYEQQDPTREEVSTYFDENAEAFSANYGVTKDSGKLVDVRHILLQPDGAEVDATTGYVTATDEQWEACRQAAQALLDSWAAGEATAESFGTLANEHSTDGGSNTTGGLYEGVMKGEMVENFDAWIFEEGRQSGDTGLVKSEFGYHIMYFVNTGDDAWYIYGRPELIGNLTNEALEALTEANPIEVDYTAIVLDSAVLGTYEETEEIETTGAAEITGVTETTDATE